MTRDELFDAVRVARPCGERWEAMRSSSVGARVCARCGTEVVDLSSRSRKEIEQLVTERQQGGRELCVRYLEREDGSIVTAEPPSRRGWVGVALAVVASSGCQRPHRPRDWSADPATVSLDAARPIFQAPSSEATSASPRASAAKRSGAETKALYREVAGAARYLIVVKNSRADGGSDPQR